MIKAKSIGEDGTAFLFLGLTATNIQRLMKGNPILIDPQEVRGLADVTKVCILYGKDTVDILKQLKTGLDHAKEVKAEFSRVPDHVSDQRLQN